MANGYVAMVISLVVFAIVVEGDGKACNWDDVDYCEQVLQNYTDDPGNWNSNPEMKSMFYCDFVELRLQCLDSLTCDKSKTTNDFPINIEIWISMIAPRIKMMADLGLCTQQPEELKPINYEDPCDKYYIYKRCMSKLSDYLKTPFAMTCVAMMKAIPCFQTGRVRCGIIDDALPPGALNPYAVMVKDGHCSLAWNPTIYEDQLRWRTKYGEDYFTYF